MATQESQRQSQVAFERNSNESKKNFLRESANFSSNGIQPSKMKGEQFENVNKFSVADKENSPSKNHLSMRDKYIQEKN